MWGRAKTKSRAVRVSKSTQGEAYTRVSKSDISLALLLGGAAVVTNDRCIILPKGHQYPVLACL